MFLIAGGGVIGVGSGLVAKNAGSSGVGDIVSGGVGAIGSGGLNVVDSNGVAIGGGSGAATTTPGSGSGTVTTSSGGGSSPTTSPIGQDSLLCGNGVCEAFLTAVGYRSSGLDTYGLCSPDALYFGIPYYCRYGASGSRSITAGYSGSPVTYDHAVCGNNVASALNSWCYASIVSNNVYYNESFANCPADCSPPQQYACFFDFTCTPRTDGSSYACSIGAAQNYKCCPTQTLFEGTCIPSSQDCQSWGSVYPTCDSQSVGLLRQTPYHCGCTSDAGCANEPYARCSPYSAQCCPGGSLHEHMCRPTGQCDVSG